MRGNRCGIASGGSVFVLLDGFHGGVAERSGASQHGDGFYAAGGIHEGVDFHIAGDEAVGGVGRRDGTNGLQQFGRAYSGVFLRDRGRDGI